jgi:hypothetical protein
MRKHIKGSIARKNNKGDIGPDQVDLGPHKLEASFLVCVSTRHVTKQDCDILSSGASGGSHSQYVFDKPDVGFLVSVWGWAEDEEGIKLLDDELKKLGHSDAYINVCHVLAAAGAKYLDLDCDGPCYDFLPMFEW